MNMKRVQNTTIPQFGCQTVGLMNGLILKRFMFDFAYGRGGYLLYPNLKDGAALARTLCLPGVHYVTSDPRLADIPIATKLDGLSLDVEWPS